MYLHSRVFTRAIRGNRSDTLSDLTASIKILETGKSNFSRLREIHSAENVSRLRREQRESPNRTGNADTHWRMSPMHPIPRIRECAAPQRDRRAMRAGSKGARISDMTDYSEKGRERQGDCPVMEFIWLTERVLQFMSSTIPHVGDDGTPEVSPSNYALIWIPCMNRGIMMRAWRLCRWVVPSRINLPDNREQEEIREKCPSR